jgi:hypothetical protein
VLDGILSDPIAAPNEAPRVLESILSSYVSDAFLAPDTSPGPAQQPKSALKGGIACPVHSDLVPCWRSVLRASPWALPSDPLRVTIEMLIFVPIGTVTTVSLSARSPMGHW